MSILTCVRRGLIDIRAEFELLLGQLLQNFSSFSGAGPIVGKRSMKGYIPPGKESLQTGQIRVEVVLPGPQFPVCHALRSRFRETAPANGLNVIARRDLR